MEQIEFHAVSAEDVDLDELLRFYQQQCDQATSSPERLREMVERSCCFVTARENGRLIGLARGLTDGVRGYLTECKLDPAYQGPAALTRTDGRIEHDQRGIAREMAMRVLESLRELGVERVDVTAHGTEEDFCLELGFRKARGAVVMQMDPRTLLACQPVGAET